MIDITYLGMCKGCKHPQLELYKREKEDETQWMLICKKQWDCTEESRKETE